ncbi:TonB-dependent receptor [Sphingopyxis sp. XHP0097]|uniref:TonB-dependent receptor n=1 Tax=Sphingopyxis jiangsuensis TaxID=2871171 RepID=A0ABS7MEZ4_9SPHN|nr:MULTISPECIES: TonB-dependent receptor [Sphingopyxis]MBL0769555.1 TonB-dependent receptor [Sphingopyxis lutea]MBY4637337.1 TonB-dependent receptor [Sphingopyxis jiangsuensis]
MRSSARSLRRAVLATSALSMLGFAPAAFAQDEGASAASDDDAIVVTARRRDERLIDVPIAVSSISGEALANAGAIDITDVAASAPNVTLEVSRGTNNTLSAFIRGVGQQDPVAGFEAGVGLYLDDVVLNRPQGAVLDIYDVERIEVLRGPQGTLYGRNTIGGAVKYVTKRIGDTAEFKLRGTYGSYDQADGVISAAVPLGDGTVRVGGAVARLSRGGFGTNLTTGRENYNKDVWAGRGTVEIVPGDDAFFRITGDYTRDKSETRGGHRLITSLATGAPVLDDVFDSRGALVSPTQDVEAWGFSALGELKPTDWLTVRTITGYRKDDSATPIDFDALPAVDLDVPAFYNNKQISQEIQLLFDVGRFNGLIGGYYLDASARTTFDVRLPGTVTALTFGDVDTRTGAIFGDFTYDITDQLSLSAGGRYTWDRRTSIVQRNVYLGSSPFFGGTTAPIVRQTDFRGTADFKKFTPRASIAFKPTQDHTVYASYSKGFKGGGFDPRGVGTAAPDANGNGIGGAGGDYEDIYNFLSFDPETVDSYELGWKGQLFDRRLTFALAAFYADYTDIQIPGSVGAVVGGVQTFIGITTNAGKATFKGLEFEGNLVAARDFGVDGDSLNFSWALGYLDAKFDRFIDSRGIDVADRRSIQNTPDLTASGTLSYSTPVGEGSINASTTISYRSASQQFEIPTPGLDQPGFALWDANLVWNIDDIFSLGVHGRNLTNKRYITSGYNFLRQNPDTGQFILLNGQPGISSTLGAEGVLTAYYGNPRQVFVTGTVKF